MGWRWSGTKNGVGWRSAGALSTLGTQVAWRWPNRDTPGDGTVASSGHTAASPTSDHEPSVAPAGLVCAIDIAHNKSADGSDVGRIFESIRLAKDARVKYAIHNRRIFSSYATSTRKPFVWAPYSGSNPHTSHGHLSVVSTKALYDDKTAWNIEQGGDELALSNEDQERLKRFLDGIDAFNAQIRNADDQTSEYGVGRLGSEIIRQHTRAAGTGWDHPAVGE